MTLRVAFLLDSLTPGGTETSTVTQLPALRAAGVEPVVVVLEDRPSPLTQQVRDLDVPLTVLGGGSGPARTWALRRWLRHHRPDVLHTALMRADMVGRLAAAGTGVPVVAGLVSTPYAAARHDDPNVDRRRLEVLRRADAVTARHLVAAFHAVSGIAADHAVEQLGIDRDRVTVVRRGRPGWWAEPVDAADVDAVRDELGLDPDRPVLLAVGRLEFAKGHVDLIEAVARLDRDVVCLVAGKDGSAAGAVRAAVDRHGVGGRTRLVGMREDVRTLLGLADVFVMPSRYEGLPGALVEALGAGTPTVASDLPGIREALGPAHPGPVVPPADPAALATAIATVLDDEELRRRQVEAGRRRFREAFDLDRNAAALAALHREVAGR